MEILIILVGLLLFLLGVVCGIVIICALISSGRAYVNLGYFSEDEFFGDEHEKSE